MRRWLSLKLSKRKRSTRPPGSLTVRLNRSASCAAQGLGRLDLQPRALPVLSFTMSELYCSYVRSGRFLTAADYQELDGATGALSQRADEISAGLDAEHQNTLRLRMLRMMALKTGAVARRRVPMD